MWSAACWERGWSVRSSEAGLLVGWPRFVSAYERPVNRSARCLEPRYPIPRSNGHDGPRSGELVRQVPRPEPGKRLQAEIESATRKGDGRMQRSRFTEQQIIGVQREQEAGIIVLEVSRRHGISEPTFYAWKATFGGMGTSDVKRPR